MTARDGGDLCGRSVTILNESLEKKLELCFVFILLLLLFSCFLGGMELCSEGINIHKEIRSNGTISYWV